MLHVDMRGYEKKIDNLMSEVGTLKNEVSMRICHSLGPSFSGYRYVMPWAPRSVDTDMSFLGPLVQWIP